MGYLEELHRAHKQRLQRLSVRDPAAGPIVVKPQPHIVKFDRFGKRIEEPKVEEPPPLPKYPPLPAPKVQPVPGQVTISRVIMTVAHQFDLSVKDMMSRSRVRSVCHPRQVAMYLATQVAMHGSLPRIGRCFGGYDHTTILNARNVVAARLEKDPSLALKVETIKGVLLEGR